MNFQEAVDTALSSVMPLDEEETVDVSESLGRILSENIFAPRDNPPFNRSTMDGYAVRSSEILDASQEKPALLPVTGESFIGEPHKTLPDKGGCFKISTGAIVPEGADAVVKVESTSEKDGTVEIYESVRPSENIAESGSDIVSSELLMLQGKEIETNDIAVLASLGISEIHVFRRLRVNVISTGNELIGHNQPYSEGRINDANGVVITSELNSYKCINARYSGIVKDDYDSILDMINKGMGESDVVILSGGSSAGESDLVYRIIEEFDPGLIFHGVLVKPGLPTVLGKNGDKVIIGLPGFPVSALMIFRSIFFMPLLRAARSMRIPSVITGKLGTNLRLDLGKQNLIPVTISGRGGGSVYPVTGLSGSISRFTSTSGFISIPGNTKFLESGSKVSVTLWNSRIEQKEMIASGMILGDLGDPFRKELSGMGFQRMLPRDSLRSLANGDTDITAFYATSDFDLDAFVRKEMGGQSFSIFCGPATELGVATEKPLPGMREVYGSIESGSTFSGPSLRFLKNILSGNANLRTLTDTVEKHVSNYRSINLHYTGKSEFGHEGIAICTGNDAGNKGYEFMPVAEVMPAYITRKDLEGRFAELFDVSRMKRFTEKHE